MSIAIVGLSCRLLEAPVDPEGLWKVFVEQRDVWQTIPNQRLDNGAFCHPDPEPGSSLTCSTVIFARRPFPTGYPCAFDTAYFNLTDIRSVARYR